MIERVEAAGGEDVMAELVEILCDSVASGASVGFLPPLAEGEARSYWQGVLADVAEGKRVLLVARQNGRAAGTVQIELPGKPNARHRAEVQKLLVHTGARRQGLGRALLGAIEAEALARGRVLLVLDTRQGDSAEPLYQSHGYTRAGEIPHYARNGEGGLDATVIYYRWLG